MSSALPVIVDHTDSAVTDGRAAFTALARWTSAALADVADLAGAALRVIDAATAALTSPTADAPAP